MNRGSVWTCHSWRTACIGIFLLLMGGASHALTTLSLAHIYPPEHPTARSLQHFSEQVKARSHGRLLVKVYPQSSMGHQMAILQSMKNGSLDLAVMSQGNLSSVVPEANAFGLPFLFPDTESAWRVLDGAVGRSFAERIEAKGFVVLSFWDVEVRQLSNSVRPLLKPADVAGLRFRTPPDPLAAEVIAALGGKPMELNFGDLHDALREGVVDGQENPLVNIRALKLYEVQKYISLTGHKFSIYSFLMTKAAWGGLSVADRELVLAAAREAARFQRTLTQNAESEAHRELAARGMRIDKVDPKPFVAATAKVYDKWYASPIGDFVKNLVKAARGQQ